MNISFSGFHNEILTFICEDDSVRIGDLVTLSSPGSVIKSAGLEFIGKAVSVKNGYVGVLISGTAVIPCGDISIDLGYYQLSTDAQGNAVNSDSGPYRLVIDKNETDKTITIIL